MGTSYKNHGGAFLSLNYFQVHLSFVFQTILLANLNVNADHCILLFLDQGNFEIWRVNISKHDSSDKRNLRDWHMLFVFLLLLLLLLFFLLLLLLVGGVLPSDIVTSFFAGGSGKTKHLVYHSFMFLLYFLSVISLLCLIFFYSKILYLPARKGSQEEKGMVAEDDTSCLLFWCVAAQVLLLLGVRMRLLYSTWFFHSKRLNSDYQAWSYKKKSRTRL